MTDAEVEKKSWLKTILSVPFFYAFLFCIALVIFEYFVFPPKYPRLIFIRHWAAANYVKLLVFCGLSLCSTLLMLLFCWAAFSSRQILRIIYFLIFAVVLTAEYSIFYAFGRFSSLVDLATALYGVDFYMGSEAVITYFNWISLLPIAAFALLLFLTKKTASRGVSSFASIMIAFILYFIASTYFTSNHYYSPSLSNFVRTGLSYPTGWFIGTIDGPPRGIVYAAPRDVPTFAAAEPPRNNIVFIVDESIRGDRLSINGHTRPTTPTLDELNTKGAIVNWGIAVSSTTCSHTSNPLLLTGINQLPDKKFEIYRWPTIFQYARAMGYKNHYYDGHTNVQWLGKESDIPDYGSWTKAEDLARPHRYERDAEIARRVKKVLSSSTGNFIWVHKYGVHLRYENSFPNERYGEVLDALPADYDLTQHEETMRLMYDEAVTYNLESFFATLFKDGPAANTIYIYTSDHGQTLRENGSVTSHCDETKPEANVPLMMIARARNLPNVDAHFRATHANIFATLLDLMKYPETERKFAYSTSLLKAKAADSKPRVYYSDELQFAKQHLFE
jgi:glucan phosphoethanolaminetransferase (alkaline phosphatase superfamily)